MKKNIVLLLVTLLLAPALLPAQGQGMTWQCPSGYEGQTLNVFNWPLYIAEDTLSNFEEACGVTVNYDLFISNEILLTILRSGNPGFDIVVPTGYAITAMIRDGLLQPLDMTKIPNRANLRLDLLNPEYDPDNSYTLPYQWGTIAVGYNTERLPTGLSSWEQVWSHPGPVAWIEDRRMMFGFALILLGHDPNTQDAAQIAEASAYLRERSGNVVAIADDNFRNLLLTGRADIVLAFDGYILTLAEECGCDTYAYALLEEASGIWVDNLAIPAGAPNPELATLFIDYILAPQVGADISNATAYASPNQAAIDRGLIDEALRLSNPGYSATGSQVNFFSIIETSAAQEQQYNAAWEALLRAIGF